MSSQLEPQEIMKRLQALEEENARLRKSTKNAADTKLTVVEGQYQGHPTLTFQGPFRQFTLGVKKLTVLKEAWTDVESFLQRHANGKVNQSTKEDDDKI